MFLLFTNGRQKPHGVKGLALGGRAEVGTEKKNCHSKLTSQLFKQ